MMMGMGFGFIGMLLLWGIPLMLVLGGAVWLFRQTTGAQQPGGQRQPTARQVLDQRLARGEIDRAEYEAIRAQLEG
jgi:putative membrane protein